MRRSSATGTRPSTSPRCCVTVIAALAILGETLSLTKLLGVLLVLAGVIVLVR